MNLFSTLLLISVHYIGIKPYICRACGRRFTQVTSLNDHKAYCRAVTKPIQCSHCSEQIAPHLFRKHMLDAHGILEVFVPSRFAF